MQVNPPGPGLITPASTLRQINGTPQLTLPIPTSTLATILSSFPVPGTGESHSGQLLLNQTQELLNYISEYPLRVGQTLELVATDTQRFKIVDVQTSAPTLMEMTAQTLKDLLPQTAPDSLPQLIAQLQELTQRQQEVPDPALTHAAQILLQQLPVLTQSNCAEHLQKWVETSRTPPELLLAENRIPADQQPEQLLQHVLDLLDKQPTKHSTPANNAAPATASQSANPMVDTLIYVIKRQRNVPTTTPPLNENLIPTTETSDPLQPTEPTHVEHSLLPAVIPQPMHDQNNPHSNSDLPLPHADISSVLSDLKIHIKAFLADQQLHRALSILPTNSIKTDSSSIVQHLAKENQQTLFSGQIPLIIQQQICTIELHIGRNLDDSSNEQEGFLPGNRNDSNKTKPRWIISLGFKLAQLGSILIRGELQHHSLSTEFWAEQLPALHMLQEEVDWLRNQLQPIGINISSVRMHTGIPEQNPNTTPLRLIDVSV